MNAYQLAQEWNDLRWGTVMAIKVMIGSKLVQLRARGICSLAVTDPSRLEEHVPDPENLISYVKSLLAQTITDLIGEQSSEVSDVALLTGVTTLTIELFQKKLESKFSAVGLKLKNVSIETIESL